MPLALPRVLIALVVGVALAVGADPAHAVRLPGSPPDHLHGLWIRHSNALLQSAHADDAIRSFCTTAGIDDVYVSFNGSFDALDALQLVQLIKLLHEANVSVEALLSSDGADQAGAARTHLLDSVQAVVQFNRDHAGARFDGIHLDIQPQRREGNRDLDPRQFLPGLIDAYRAVRAFTDRHGLTLDADLDRGLLQSTLEQRRALLESTPRLTVLLYGLTTPADSADTAQRLEQARNASIQVLQQAYAGLDQPRLARLAIALRTEDYGTLLPQVLSALDAANRGDPHYLGWARDSYIENQP
jgi:hypothetical protein